MGDEMCLLSWHGGAQCCRVGGLLRLLGVAYGDGWILRNKHEDLSNHGCLLNKEQLPSFRPMNMFLDQRIKSPKRFFV